MIGHNWVWLGKFWNFFLVSQNTQIKPIKTWEAVFQHFLIFWNTLMLIAMCLKSQFFDQKTLWSALPWTIPWLSMIFWTADLIPFFNSIFVWGFWGLFKYRMTSCGPNLDSPPPIWSRVFIWQTPPPPCSRFHGGKQILVRTKCVRGRK